MPRKSAIDPALRALLAQAAAATHTARESARATAAALRPTRRKLAARIGAARISITRRRTALAAFQDKKVNGMLWERGASLEWATHTDVPTLQRAVEAAEAALSSAQTDLALFDHLHSHKEITSG